MEVFHAGYFATSVVKLLVDVGSLLRCMDQVGKQVHRIADATVVEVVNAVGMFEIFFNECPKSCDKAASYLYREVSGLFAIC